MELKLINKAIEINMEINPGIGYEGDRYGMDLLTRAIVHLIENFDTHLAEKEVAAYWDTQQYYATILSAIARHYVVDCVVEREMTVEMVLAELIAGLVESGMLQEKLGVNSDDYNDE